MMMMMMMMMMMIFCLLYYEIYFKSDKYINDTNTPQIEYFTWDYALVSGNNNYDND